MVANYNAESSFKSMVERARAVKHGTSSLEAPADEVIDTAQVNLMIERQMIAVSETEMRKLTKNYRIRKTKLAGIPAVEIPSDTGSGNETVYLFADEEAPYRKARLQVSSATVWNKSVMDRGSGLRAQQGANMHAYATQTKTSASGLRDFLDKDAGGHLSLMLFEDLCKERLLKSEQSTGEDNNAELVDLVDSPVPDLTLVGVAAKDAEGSAFATPQPKKKPQSPHMQAPLQRAGSSASLLGGYSEAASEMSGYQGTDSACGDDDTGAVDEGSVGGLEWLGSGKKACILCPLSCKQ